MRPPPDATFRFPPTPRHDQDESAPPHRTTDHDHETRPGARITRGLLGRDAAATFGGSGPQLRAASGPIKGAAISLLPVDPHWMSRIHVAAETAVARDVVAGDPNTAFLIGSSCLEGPALPNVSLFDNAIQDASHLTGLIAGTTRRSGSAGLAGGFPISEVTRVMNAVMAATREMTPGIHVHVIVLAIGNAIDTNDDYPNRVATSALWLFEPTLEHTPATVRDGRVTALFGGGGAGLAP